MHRSALMALVVAFPANAMALVAIGGVERRVTTDPADQLDPAISGDLVVFTDYRGADADVWYFDLRRGVEAPVTTAPGSQAVANVAAPIIVYADLDRREVLAFATTSATTVNLTPSGWASQARAPAVGGTLVAWEDSRSFSTSSYDIYARDLATGEERRVSSSARADRAAAVGARTIVWESCGFGPGTCDIWSYDWDGDTVRQLTSTGDDERDPDIWGTRVVWSEGSAPTGERDIVLFDLGDGSTRRLRLDGNQLNPSISGDLVAFEDLEEGLYHVKLWHLPTDSVIDLAGLPNGPPSAASQYLSDLDGHRIAYTDDRGGQLDVYVYELEVEEAATTRHFDCDHLGDAAPLLDVVLERGSTRPSTHYVPFTSRPVDGLVCIDNGVDGSRPLGSGWLWLNWFRLVDADDWAPERCRGARPGARDDPEECQPYRTLERRFPLDASNILLAQLPGKPGYEVRVRIFESTKPGVPRRPRLSTRAQNDLSSRSSSAGRSSGRK